MTMPLRGPWTAAAVDDEIRRAVAENRTDGVGAWHDVEVPGEWRTSRAFVDHVGAVAYRTTIPEVEASDGDRLFVECEGIFDQADIWYDGAYLGDQEDHFLPGRHEFGSLARLGGPRMLVIEVNGGERAGPWLPVNLRRTGPVAIEALRVLCRDAGEERAHLLISARLDASMPAATVVRTTVAGRTVGERVHRLARGANTLSWTLDVDRPELWWPRTLGEPRLTEVVLEVLIDGAISDVARRTTGIREVSVDNWNLTVNGERIHAKGAYLDLPEDPGTPDDPALAARLALDTGLDLLRLRRHVAHPALYRAADSAGLLLWQDVPARPSGRAGGRRGRRRAERVASGLVDVLGHHPSIVLWHHDFADGWTHRALVRADPTRSALGHLSTAVPSRAATDPRVAILRGALSGVTADLAASIAVVPNIARFPTVEQWRLVAPAAEESPGTVRARIETLRTVRFRPGSGFCHLKLQDSSVLDNEGLHDGAGRPRPVRDAVRDACAPVIVAFAARPDDEDSIGMVVVNDTRTTWPRARLTVRVDGNETSSWEGPIAADEVSFVADLDLAALRALGGRECTVTLVDADSGATIAANTLSLGDPTDHLID